ncbi:MAG TPA: hypothetical protein VHK67_03345 [Rhabdochlamydiaceae bacterium]|nr:hypothetical protein [Rhabdochlamydiaceae bacterium]
MSTGTNATARSNGSQVVAQSGASSSIPQRAREGIGKAASTIYSAGAKFTAKGRSFLYLITVAPISWVWSKITGLGRWVLDKIYGKGRVPAATIEVEMKGWTGTYITKVSLESALEKGYITPAQAKEKGHCNDDYLKARGYNEVEFEYKGALWGTKTFKGLLRDALRGGYITINEAIEAPNNFMTEKQAIEGGWKQAPKK